MDAADAADAELFQTDPCGVEAVDWLPMSTVSVMFQTDPCGVEA